jgi:putative transposase
MDNELVCKYCQSQNVRKYGLVKGIQRYFCNDCRRKFVSTETIPKMQTPTKVIADSLNMHYEGMSLAEIRRNFIQQDNNYLSKVTPYNWEKRFTVLAQKEAEKYHPKVGDTWQSDETVIHNNWGGKKKRLWLIDIIDRDTRFMLASKLSLNRNARDIASAMKEAKEKAGKSPKRIMTDGWSGYRDGIELVFGSDTEHVLSTPFKDKEDSTNIVERVQGTLKERTKVMRGLKTLDSMNAFLKGWIIHYNYFRPHLSLQDRTPAEVAGINFPYRNWKELIEKQPYSVTARIPMKRMIVKTPIIKIPKQAPRIRTKRTHIQNLGMGIVREHGRQHISIEPPHWVEPHQARHGTGITRRSDR